MIRRVAIGAVAAAAMLVGGTLGSAQAQVVLNCNSWQPFCNVEHFNQAPAPVAAPVAAVQVAGAQVGGQAGGAPAAGAAAATPAQPMFLMAWFGPVPLAESTNDWRSITFGGY
jgi:hypothetical protein